MSEPTVEYRLPSDKMAAIHTLATRYRYLKAHKANLQNGLTATNKELDQIRKVDLVKLFEELEIEKMSLNGIGDLAVRADLYCSIKAAAKADAYEFLEEVGAGDLISVTVNASRLKAWVKEAMQIGTFIPDDLITVTPFTYVDLK
jgi:hypothetical protein